MNNPKYTLDRSVLSHLREVEGSTAWAMHKSVKATRVEVSKACQRLKRLGLVSNNGPYWQAVKP